MVRPPSVICPPRLLPQGSSKLDFRTQAEHGLAAIEWQEPVGCREWDWDFGQDRCIVLPIRELM